MEVKVNVCFRFSLAGADHSVSHETKHANTIFLQKHLHVDLKNKHELKWPVKLSRTNQCLAVPSKVLVNPVC